MSSCQKTCFSVKILFKKFYLNKNPLLLCLLLIYFIYLHFRYVKHRLITNRYLVTKMTTE